MTTIEKIRKLKIGETLSIKMWNIDSSMQYYVPDEMGEFETKGMWFATWGFHNFGNANVNFKRIKGPTKCTCGPCKRHKRK